MTRRIDGSWELSARELRGLLMIWPLLMAAVSAGAAWMGVKRGLDEKLDRTEFGTYAQQTELRIQSLRINDSLFIAAQKEQTDRIREIVCPAIKGCR